MHKPHTVKLNSIDSERQQPSVHSVNEKLYRVNGNTHVRNSATLGEETYNSDNNRKNNAYRAGKQPHVNGDKVILFLLSEIKGHPVVCPNLPHSQKLQKEQKQY